jgi:hypothetical protein
MKELEESALIQKRKDIAQRIMNLTEEQFAAFLIMYSQGEKESSPPDPARHLTSA